MLIELVIHIRQTIKHFHPLLVFLGNLQAGAQYPRHAEIVPVAQSFGEGFEKPCDIGVAAHQHHVGSRLGTSQRHLAAQSPAASGDEQAFAVETKSIQHLSLIHI